MRWKWIVGTALVLALAFMVTVYAILSRYDFNDFKPKIAQAVKKATGRELTLAGDITLRMGLRPALIVENAGFQNVSWGSRHQMATIKRLQLQVSLIALMTGVIEVERLILLEPDILIETNKAGNSNLEFGYALADGTLKPSQHTSGEPGAVVSAVLLNKVRIRDGHLAFKSGRSGQIYDIALNNLTLVKETERLVELTLEGTYNGESCQVEGTIGPLSSLISPSKPWPVTLTAHGPMTTVTVDGEIQDVFMGRGVNLTVSGRGKSVPALLRFFGVTDVPEVGPFEATGGLTDPGGKLAARDLNLVIGDDKLAKVIVTGTIEDLVALKGLHLAVHGQGHSVPSVVRLFAESDLPDMGAFTVKGNLTDPAGMLAITGLSLELNKKDLAGIQLSGTVKNVATLEGIEMDFSAQGPELEKLEQVLRQPVPVRGPFRISGHVLSPSKKAFTLSDLKVALEGSALAGSVAVDLAGKRPRVTASLSSDRLDVRPYFGATTKAPDKGKEEEPTGIKDRVFPDTPLPLEILNRADADVEIRAKIALLPLLALEDVTARAMLRDGHLTLTPLQGHLGDGTFDGLVDLQSRAEQTKTRLALKTVQMDLGRMLNDLGIEGVLEGKLDVEIDVTGRGNSVALLMAGMNGSTVVIMEQGKINEKFVGLLSGDPRGLLHLLSVSKKDVTYRDINCLVVGLDINNGLAKTTALALDTSAVNIIGRGKVDLATENLDISLKPTPKTGVGIKGLGKFSVSLGELTKPLKVGGTLANPNVAIDPSGTMVTLGKALGGAVLLGPVGIAAALAGGKLGDEDPCPVAIETARAAVPDGTTNNTEKKGDGDNTSEGLGNGIKRLSGQ